MGPVGTAGKAPGAAGKAPGTKAAGPFEAALGPVAFGLLAPELRAFHSSGTGLWGFAGHVDILAPSPVGRLFGSLMGAPLKGYKGEFGFELKRGASGGESWTRRFPGQPLVSKLDFEDGLVVERLGSQGKSKAGFEVKASEGGLVLRLVNLECNGIGCPSWALPKLRATERGVNGWLHFDFEASAWGLGRACAYKGKIDVRKLIAEIKS